MQPMDQIVMNLPDRTESVAPVCEIDPLKDSRWTEFIKGHPRACAFHTPGWLRALKVSYGYDPFVLTTARPGEALVDGFVLCRIRSWLTGPRIVSLPFSDHCAPLFEDAGTLPGLLKKARQYQEDGDWKYVELRPLPAELPDPFSESGFAHCTTHTLHELDLRPSVEDIFSRFNKKSVRQMINRANREKLAVKEGRSEELLRMFFSLLIQTRRRHEVPPQPLSWFQNLLLCMGEKALIRVAMKDGIPVACIFTLSHNRIVMYKYGCSNAAYNNLGGTPFLVWRAIQDAKESGAEVFDFGRSDTDNPGLIAFKGHFAAEVSQLGYYRYPPPPVMGRERTLGLNLARKVFPLLPNRLLSAAGAILYRHIG